MSGRADERPYSEPCRRPEVTPRGSVTAGKSRRHGRSLLRINFEVQHGLGI